MSLRGLLLIHVSSVTPSMLLREHNVHDKNGALTLLIAAYFSTTTMYHDQVVIVQMVLFYVIFIISEEKTANVKCKWQWIHNRMQKAKDLDLISLSLCGWLLYLIGDPLWANQNRGVTLRRFPGFSESHVHFSPSRMRSVVRQPLNRVLYWRPINRPLQPQDRVSPVHRACRVSLPLTHVFIFWWLIYRLCYVNAFCRKLIK